MTTTQILDQQRIQRITDRIAFQILEDNLGEPKVILAGISERGYTWAEQIAAVIRQHHQLEVQLGRINLNKQEPEKFPIQTDLGREQLENSSVIVIDDVLNTGRTLIYAIQPFAGIRLKKLKVAVLVDRNHRNYPITADYTGLSLSTTLQEHVEVNETLSEAVLQ